MLIMITFHENKTGPVTSDGMSLLRFEAPVFKTRGPLRDRKLDEGALLSSTSLCRAPHLHRDTHYPIY